MRWSIAWLVLLPACIPVRKTYVLWPEGTVRVVARGTNAPIGAAKIRLVRHSHPYSRVDGTLDVVADGAGEHTFQRETVVRKVYPLMIHGVPGYSFVACAEAPGRAAITRHWTVPNEGRAETLKLELPEGSRPCEVVAGAPPSSNTARVLGIEREDANTWKIEVALAPETRLRKRARLEAGAGSLTVIEVVFQSDPPGAFRRAEARVRGDGSPVQYGDRLQLASE